MGIILAAAFTWICVVTPQVGPPRYTVLCTRPNPPGPDLQATFGLPAGMPADQFTETVRGALESIEKGRNPAANPRPPPVSLPPITVRDD